MLRDLVHVSAPCNFKTIHFYYITRLQIRTVVTRSISGNEPVNNRVLQGNFKIKISDFFNQQKNVKIADLEYKKNRTSSSGNKTIRTF